MKSGSERYDSVLVHRADMHIKHKTLSGNTVQGFGQRWTLYPVLQDISGINKTQSIMQARCLKDSRGVFRMCQFYSRCAMRGKINTICFFPKKITFHVHLHDLAHSMYGCYEIFLEKVS